MKRLPAENLGDTAVGDLQDARDVARPGARVRQLYDLLPGAVRQGSPVHIDPAQLVDPTVACSRASKYRTSGYVMFLL